MAHGLKIEDLNRAVRRYPTHQTLGLINRISVEEGEDSEIAKYFPGPVAKGHKSPIFSQHGLAFVARQSILHSNDHRGAVPTWQNVARLCSIYNYIDDPLLEAPTEDKFALVQFLVRTAYEQFPLQQNIKNLISRALHLFEILPRELMGSRHALDLDSIFRQVTGLGIREFLQYGFLCWATSTKRPFFRSSEFVAYQQSLSFFTEEGMKHFLGHVASDYEQFRDAAKREEAGLSWAKQAFNSLWQWPIIRPTVKEFGEYVVPIPRLQLHRVTDGLYYDFLNPQLPEATRDRFLTFFGDVFQAYVGKLLQPYYGPSELFAEMPYGRGQTTVDWMAVENRTAILFECKSKRFTKMSKRIALRDDLIRDLKLAIVGGAKQIFETQQAVLQKAPGLEPLHGVEQALPLLIVSEPLYLANTPLLRELVRSELKNAGLEGFDFQVISVRELEYLLPFKEKRPITDILTEKFQSPDVKTWDLSAFLREGPDAGVGHKLLDETLDAFADSLGPSADQLS